MAARAVVMLAALFLACLFQTPTSSSVQSVQVLSAVRRIDLTSHIVRISLNLKVKNFEGSSAPEILLSLSEKQVEHLALIKATSLQGKKKKKNHVELPVAPISFPGVPDGVKLFSVTLLKPLTVGETATLEVFYILTNVLKPFPSEISQSESQLVLFNDNAFILSPYYIVQQETDVLMPNTKIESYTSADPTSHSGTSLKYGPYKNQPPYSFASIAVHYANNNPFSVVEELVRVVEVSHWGELHISENYILFHAGAKHQGVFSRVDYQSRPSVSGISSFRRLLARLPPRVHSMYYRDEIGNISTSHLRVGSQQTELEIEPRYPLFGGWRAAFSVGYGLPLQDFLFASSDGARFLNFSIGCPLVETIVNNLTVKVVLPEGSKMLSVSVPFLVEQLLETSYSYLDIFGRTVVVLRKTNVVPEHNVNFQVYYEFNRLFMLAEPLLLIGAVLLFFVACIAYLHVNLSIKPNEG